jgi:2-deoxy-D-gluconate 3-dehydrogenase
MTAFDLTGRTALVTGGSSGIGAAIAASLAEAGARVVLIGRNEANLRAVQQGIGAAAEVFPWDLGDGSSATELVDGVLRQVGQLDILVHAAGNQVRRPALEFTADEWDSVLGLHLRAAFLLSQAFGRYLVAARRPGNIVYIGSMTSQRAGIPNVVAYAAAKSGLLGLMRALAVEWAPHDIRVNTVLVGFVATNMTRDVDSTPARKKLTDRAPIGRLGTPEEVGDGVVFLASDAARYVTGESLTIDGGWSVA